MSKLTLHDFKWKPIHTAPLNGKFYELRGPSGYMGTPYRIIIARYESSRERPPFDNPAYKFDEHAWRDITGDHLTDAGPFPTHWRILTTEFEPSVGDAAEIGQRAAHYGDGIQPWDHIKAAGWGPQFAAGNALKYVRRYKVKNGEDDLQKGRWYYHELVTMVADYFERMTDVYKSANIVFLQLEQLLTQEERALLRHKT